jgi:DNA-binding CsgD family transcriptional regulator
MQRHCFFVHFVAKRQCKKKARKSIKAGCPRVSTDDQNLDLQMDALNKKVLRLVAAGQSYRQIGRQLDISKNTVLEIVKRNRANDAADERREIIV